MEQRICKVCGAVLSPGDKFCTNCGATPDPAPAPQPAPQQTYQQPAYQQPAYQQPAYQQPAYQAPPIATGAPVAAAAAGEPDPNGPYALIKPWGWFGISLLMCIPIVGIILTIVWACGGCQKKQKTNYARGVLIIALVAAIIAVIITVIGLILGKNLFENISSSFTSF